MPLALVVDDDPDIRDTFADVLGSLPMEVRTASNADEAMGRLQGVDLLVTDYRMPGMDGLALAAQASRSHAGMQVIVVTAYPDHDLDERAKAKGFTLLHKPIDLAALIGAARTALAR